MMLTAVGALQSIPRHARSSLGAGKYWEILEQSIPGDQRNPTSPRQLTDSMIPSNLPECFATAQKLAENTQDKGRKQGHHPMPDGNA